MITTMSFQDCPGLVRKMAVKGFPEGSRARGNNGSQIALLSILGDVHALDKDHGEVDSFILEQFPGRNYSWLVNGAPSTN